jgi:hypothetical protein
MCAAYDIEATLPSMLCEDVLEWQCVPYGVGHNACIFNTMDGSLSTFVIKQTI